MDGDEKLAAISAGIVVTIECLVDALTARNPGVAVAVSERLRARIGEWQSEGSEASHGAATIPRMLLATMEARRRGQLKD